MPSPVEVTLVETAEQALEMAEFFKTIWTDGDEVVPFDLVLAAIHVGAYAALAKNYQQVVGASFGFLGTHLTLHVLHSHVTAASQSGAGLALKKHQLQWASGKKLDAITWTFDPLVRRNCVFNFEKLGAVATEYLPNFYGTMTDSINAGDESDRLFAFFPLTQEANLFLGSNEESSAESARLNSATNFAVRNLDGRPERENYVSSKPFWVELPEDIENLRKSDLQLALLWRKTVREFLLPGLRGGGKIRLINQARTAILVEPKIEHLSMPPAF